MIVVCGGADGNNVAKRECRRFNGREGKWEVMLSLNTVRTMATSGIIELPEPEVKLTIKAYNIFVECELL